MRSIGLCMMAALLLAACDDATGSGYSPGTSGPGLMEAQDTSPAGRAAALGASRTIDYQCTGDTVAHVTLYGQEEMAAVTIPGVLETPLMLDCSPTRVGPECLADTFRVLIDTVSGAAEISDSATDYAVSCSEAAPE